MVDAKSRVCLKFKKMKKGRKTVKKCMMYSNAPTARKAASRKAVVSKKGKKGASKRVVSKKTASKGAKKTLKKKKSGKKSRKTLFGMVF